MEGLKNNLKEQDKRIENLKEKVNMLETQVRRESVVYFSVNVTVYVCVRQCNCEPVYECLGVLVPAVVTLSVSVCAWHVSVSVYECV